TATPTCSSRGTGPRHPRSARIARAARSRGRSWRRSARWATEPRGARAHLRESTHFGRERGTNTPQSAYFRGLGGERLEHHDRGGRRPRLRAARGRVGHRTRHLGYGIAAVQFGHAVVEGGGGTQQPLRESPGLVGEAV